MAKFNQVLPDLALYRRELAAAGAPAVPPFAPWAASGLLAQLPPPPPGREGWPWTVQTPPWAGEADREKIPSFSIVVPSYRQGRYLEQTLRSILLQNHPRLQLMVIDGGSTDESGDVIERYRPWIGFARIGADRGQSHAINMGLSLATGELSGWLNSDDFYLPGALRRVGETRRATGAEFIYGDSLALDEGSGRARHVDADFALGRYVKFPGLVPSHGSFWATPRTQPLWEDQQCAMDYELWIRLLPGLRIRHVRWPLGVIREHPEAKSHDPAMRIRWEEDMRRNGSAHPELYDGRLANRWREMEFPVVQRIARAWRRRGLDGRLRELWRECGWKTHG